jgi:glycine cleavage system H protein
MDGFSYNNIFETKGIEYLIIIMFLLLIIPFWLIINRKAGSTGKIRNAIGVLSSGILRIPQGVFYSRFHTWAYLEISGIARVGMDDLLQHITGEVKFRNLKTPGSFINKGELLAEIDQNGKSLQIFSPISGEIMCTNQMLIEEPAILNEDTFGKGWIYRIKPTKWIAETSNCFLAEEAVSWSIKELERFKDFIALSTARFSPETSMVILQDGGELSDRPLSELPNEVWQDFQKSFLDQNF